MQTNVTVVLLALLVIGSVSTHGTVQDTSNEGNLTELWVSNPPNNLASNHHSPAAIHYRDEAYIAVPLNDRHGKICSLSVLDGNGTERWRDTIPDERCEIHSVSDPTIADFDGDGDPEVIAATSEKVVVAYNLTTGKEEFRHNLTSYGYSTPIVTNFTAANGSETIVVDLLGGIFVFRQNGTLAWTRKLDDARVRQPAVADFDADGAPELAVGQLSGQVYVYENDGSVAWRTNFSDSIALRWLTTGQADSDPAVELVLATFTGHVFALDGKTGAMEWDRDLGSNQSNASVYAFGGTTGNVTAGLHAVRGASVRAFGDGDGDGQTEVYPVARDGKLYSLSANNGSIEWTTSLTSRDVTVMAPPSLGDIDEDDALELVAVDYTGQIAVVDPKTGETLASYRRDTPIRTYPTLADFDGDGIQEILVIYGDGSVVALSYTE